MLNKYKNPVVFLRYRAAADVDTKLNRSMFVETAKSDFLTNVHGTNYAGILNITQHKKQLLFNL